MSGTDYTLTPSLGLYKPIANRAVGQWGDLWNSNADTLDSAIHASSGGGPYLPLAGNATVFGPTTFSAATTFSGPVTFNDGSAGTINVLMHGAKGDGTTDDTVAIQSVLNAYAGKAVVFIPWTSTSYRTLKLTIPSNTSLLLHGKLFALPGLVSGYIDIINVSSVSIAGHGSIDANAPAQTAVGGMAGMAVANATNIRVSGIGLTNAFYWNMNVTGSSNVVFDGVTFTKGGAANEFAAGSDDCWLMNCTVDGTGLPDYAFCFYGGVTNSGAIGNLVRNGGVATGGGSPGIGILSDNAASYTQPPCKNITISNNIVHDCKGPGISCIYVSTPAGFQSGIVIANNRCYNNNTISVGSNVGNIYIDTSTDVTISGNQLSNNGSASNSSVAGIFLGPKASHISVTGNQIYNTGQGGTNGSGIWTNASYVNVSGNYIYDEQATPTMHYAIIGGGGTHCVYVGNFFDLPVNVGGGDQVYANALQGVWTVGAPGGVLDHIMALNGASGQSAAVQYQNISQPRWLVGTDGTTDSGDAGSNYSIAAYNGGVLQSPALIIARDTDNVTMRTCLINSNISSYVPQGAYIMWNHGAGGRTNFINNKGLGPGGFTFVNTDGTTDVTMLTLGPTTMIFNLVMFQNAANDAAAASAGVPIGGTYRNGSALQVRVA